MAKKSVLFVGGFKYTGRSGNVGGQMFACNSLINSRLKNVVRFHTIDTTASTNKERSFFARGAGALLRLLKFSFVLLTRKVDTVLVFCSHGWSFKEKGIMIRIAKFFGKKTIIAPRSGHLLTDIQSSKEFKAFAKTVFSKSDFIICQGTPWREFFRDTFALNEENLIVLHNWIEIREQRKSAQESENLNVLFLGWIDRAKGVYDILEVAEELKDENILWTIAGNGNEFENVKQQIEEKKLDKVNLPGWKIGTEKERLFDTTDVFVLPSYAEGFPNALLEAINHCIPVISTSVGAISDMIEDGVNGFLIEPGDTGALRDGILKLQNSIALREKFSELSYRKLKENHSIEKAVRTFEKLL